MSDRTPQYTPTLAPDDGTRARLHQLAADAYADATGRPFPLASRGRLYRTIAERVGDRWLVKVVRHWWRSMPPGSPPAELVADVWMDAATERPTVEIVVDHYATAPAGRDEQPRPPD